MREKKQIEIPKEKIEAFCRKHHIRKLSLFGSVLREDFGPDSDVDVLVEFEPVRLWACCVWQGWRLSFRAFLKGRLI